MDLLYYFLDGKSYEVSIKGSPAFQYGTQTVLSTKDNDLAFHQPWFKDGYSVVNFLNEKEFRKLKKGISDCIEQIIQKELSIDTSGFELEHYHKYVLSDKEHHKVVSKTRDLFENDLVFPITKYIEQFESILNCKLTDTIPFVNEKMHIIIRINRPNSSDFNPPHKDIYEVVDEFNTTVKMINFWIPIAGVTDKSSLPVVPSSHLLSEDKILRTNKGGVVNGNTYRVRLIHSWEGSNKLIRSNVAYGKALVFSSYIIHGLAVNEEEDTTRVALEFRLFEKNKK